MYESPINRICGEIQSQIIKQDEENVMYAVNQAIGYSVDKQELIQALRYDRDQYDKGYTDGKHAMDDRNREIIKHIWKVLNKMQFLLENPVEDSLYDRNRALEDIVFELKYYISTYSPDAYYLGEEGEENE